MPIKIAPLDRFKVKIKALPNDCWEWTGAINHKGYGLFSYKGHPVIAHRFAYEQLIGPISDGLTLDHLCRNRRCVNPAHLEPITNRLNCRRGNTGIKNALKTRCPAGHQYTSENTYVYKNKDGREMRSCRKCHTEREAKRRLS